MPSLGQSSWATQHQGSAWVQTYKWVNAWWRKLSSPNSAFQEQRGQPWPARTNISAHSTAAPLKRKSLCVCFHFPSCCHTPMVRQACYFPCWPFTVTSFSTPCWQQSPITCMSSFRAAFVRMKVLSQSCATRFDNTGLVSWLCSISMQNNGDFYYIWGIN